MEALIKGIEGIIQFFENIIQFIETFISGVVWLVQILPTLYIQVTTLVSYCPPFVVMFLMISWMLIILFAVIKLF